MFPALGRRPSEGTREPRTLFVRLHQGGPRTSHTCTNIVRMDPRAPNLPHSDGAPLPVRTDRDIFAHPLALCLCRKTSNGPCTSFFRTRTGEPRILQSVRTGRGTANVPPTLVRIPHEGGPLKLPHLHKFRLDGDLGTPNFCTRTVSTHVLSVRGGQISHACTMDRGGTPNPLDSHEFRPDIYRGTPNLHISQSCTDFVRTYIPRTPNLLGLARVSSGRIYWGTPNLPGLPRVSSEHIYPGTPNLLGLALVSSGRIYRGIS